MKDGIVLVNPPWEYAGRTSWPPLGLALIGGELESNGYEGLVSIIDGCNYVRKYGQGGKTFERIREDIGKSGPKIIGCTVNHNTTYPSIGICDYAMSSDSNIVLGGYYATANHLELSKALIKMSEGRGYHGKMVIVRGEGEKAMVELADSLFNGKEISNIKGITFCDGEDVVVNSDREPVDINELRSPAFHLLPPSSEYEAYTLEESRGCYWDCQFCSIKRTHPKPRMKDVQKIREELEIIKKIGGKRVDLIGELLLWDGDRALKIADAMHEFGYSWTADAHPTLILKQRKILPALRERGLYSIETGIESQSRKSLERFNKKTTPEINRRAIETLEKSKIIPSIDFIVFEPYMNMRDLYYNMLFIADHLDSFSSRSIYPEILAQAWIPHHGTPLFEKALEDSRVRLNKNGVFVPNYRSRRVSRVLKSLDYFMQKYANGYRLRAGKIRTSLKEEHGSESLIDARAGFLSSPPLFAFLIAYDSAMKGVPAEKHIDKLMNRYFDAIDSGDTTPMGDIFIKDSLNDIDKEVAARKGN
jgi:hypothetical protein